MIFRINFILLILSLGLPPSYVHATPSDPGFQETLFIGGLTQPTAMQFAPDGALFVCEKAGRLEVIERDSVTGNPRILPTPFFDLTSVVLSDGERGLLGVAFDPNFSSTGYVYVYYSKRSPLGHRVSRFSADNLARPRVAQPNSEFILLDGIPDSSGTSNHNGGAIHFRNDGTSNSPVWNLYIAVGDDANSANAQRLINLNGKILRIRSDGSIPNDNPTFSSHADANDPNRRREIWAYGLRNPFTFAVDPATWKLYINDVGQNTWEEVNEGLPGANFGWPTCEGPQNTGVGTCNRADFTYPISYYPNAGSECAITGGVFYQGAAFPPEYKGNYYFGDYCGGWVRRLRSDRTVVNFATGLGSPLDMKIGPDGAMYVLIYGGSVRRIASTTANRQPTAAMTVSNSNPGLNQAVNFDASGSSDPDGDGLTYSWDFGDGQTATGVNTTHAYNRLGTFTASLTVSDGKGGNDTDSWQIQVGVPPTAQISQPSQGTTYRAGDTILYAGQATNAGGSDLPASAFSWTLVFHHDNHTHPFLGPINGQKSGTFVIPQAGEAAANVFYRIQLTVTDGLSTTVTRDVTPETTSLTFATNPSGMQITLDGQPQNTPFTVVGVEGFIRSLSVGANPTLNNLTYEFVSWSDGGARQHDITTPTADTTYTATFRLATMPPAPPRNLRLK